MNSADFLVEIGTEELPPKALKSLSEAFGEGILAGLAEKQLSHGPVTVFASPRRLALLVTDLQLAGADQAQEILGPPADRARDEQGNWTPAAAGFAKKQGVAADQLETVETEKGPRLAFRQLARGAQAAQCLPAVVEASVKALPIPKRMRWGAGRTEFVRPVHWLVMLLGQDIVDCNILGCKAGRVTRGHRFHSPGEISLAQPGDYEASLREARVVASFAERQATVQAQVEAAAATLGAQAVVSAELLEEVTALVEWPVALTGGFEPQFLEIPAEALVSSMKEHQKYFHLVDKKGRLLPNFITVSNIESKDPGQVIDGNERVIRPRLSDADFFFRTDQKTCLADRVEALKNIVFQQQLGTLYDKTLRMQSLAGELAGLMACDTVQAQRAALLSKTDLLTLMVGEFADMQGIAGRYYALHDGEAEPVADALQQQYWPRFAGDQLPQGSVATVLALADRLDTLVGIFGIGQPPTGSRDPFALRRASLGVLRIMVEGELELDLHQCLELAYQQYAQVELVDDTVSQVSAYMIDRFRAWYEDEAIAAEVFKAVSARNLSVPLDIHRRVHAVHAFSQLPEAAALAAANKRVSNILEKQASEFSAGEVSKDLLTDAAESELYNQVGAQQQLLSGMLQNARYTEALASLAGLRGAVDQFFEDVMVMADDQALRQNRLRLLHSLRELFLQVADISLLAPGK